MISASLLQDVAGGQQTEQSAFSIRFSVESSMLVESQTCRADNLPGTVKLLPT